MKISLLQLLVLPILALTLLSSNCKKSNLIQAAEATIELSVMSRGAYQYLIHVGTDKYMSSNLPAEFQQNELKVILDYKVLDEKGMVYKPGPTDVPQEDYEVPMIDIVAIKKK